MEDVRLVVRDDFHYMYPDVVVSCDPADRRYPLLIQQPVLIVEVLLPSTADYDRGRKFNQYKKLVSTFWFRIRPGCWSGSGATMPGSGFTPC